MKTDPITIGRDPVLSQRIAVAIHRRRIQEREAARRREKRLRIRKKAIDALRFWR